MFQCGLLYWPVIYRRLSADGPGSQDTHTVTGAHTFQPHEERWVHTLTRTEPDHPVTALTTNPPATPVYCMRSQACVVASSSQAPRRLLSGSSADAESDNVRWDLFESVVLKHWRVTLEQLLRAERAETKGGATEGRIWTHVIIRCHD